MPLITKPSNMSTVWATSGVKEEPSSSKIAQGWVVELPPYQFENWLENKQDSFMAHVNQLGVPVWDAGTEYQGGKSYTQGSDGLIYKAISTNTNVDPSNPLNSAIWARAFEEYGSVAAVQAALNTHITNYNSLANIVNLVAARNNLSVWSKAESDARFAFKAGAASQAFSVATATVSTHAVPLGQLQTLLSQATESQAGIAAIASQSEMDVGTNNTKIVTPLKGAATYLRRNLNLSDLASASTARVNLGLTSTATTALSDFLLKAGNLSGLTNLVTARSNLGLGTMAVENVVNYLAKADNLSGLASVSIARTNLGLGNSATLNVGITVNTVAAGDDSRIVNAVPNSRLINAGNGLTGGGALTASVTLTMGTPSSITISSSNSTTSTSHTHDLDVASFTGIGAGTFAAGNDSRIVNAVPNTRTVSSGNGLTGGGSLGSNVTITMGTPSSITPTSTNTATPTSHTHAFDISSFFSDRLIAADGYYVLPGNLCLQWGTGPALNDDQSATVTLPRPDVTILSVQVTGFGTVNASVGPSFVSGLWTTTNFRVGNNYSTGAYAFRWFAVTVLN